MKLSELQKKNIVELSTGKIVGKIIDVDFNIEDGKLTGFVLERSKYLKSIFSTESDLIIKYEEIKKIGTDVILVEIQ